MMNGIDGFQDALMSSNTMVNKIPSFIAKTLDKGAHNRHNIPLVIYQTWHSNDIPRRMYDNIKRLLKTNPEFDYHFYSDDDCLKFIKDNFDENVVNSFEMLIPGAFKADLWRYCVLYKKGGVYLDIKYYSTEPLYPIIERLDKVFVLDSPEAYCVDTKYGIYNGFMVVPPKNPTLLMCINDIIQSSKHKLLRKSSLDVTGPCLLGRKLYEKNPTMKTHFQYENYEETSGPIRLPMGRIKFMNRIILLHYNGYREDQKSLQKTEHYHELYQKKRIWNDLEKYSFHVKKTHNIGSAVNSIPLVIYETWHTRNITAAMKTTIDRLLLMNPEFDFYLYDKDDCAKFIQKNFNKEVLDAYNCLGPVAFKADLWRYCILYKNGGVYIDIKFTTNLKLLYFIEKYGAIYVKDIPTFCKNGIINGFIVTPPNNPIFKECIDEIVASYKSKSVMNNVLDLTGPCLLGRKLEKLNVFQTSPFYLQTTPNLTINHNDEVFLQAYGTYMEERDNTQLTKHYSELYPENVWCTGS